MSSPVHVTSEIGRLRRVLVHEPGPEVDGMVPAMMEELLFDDILFGERARDEHRRFKRVLQVLGVETVEASTLLGEALTVEAARTFLLDAALAGLSPMLREEMRAAPAEQLAAMLVGGVRPATAHGGIEVEDLYEIPPLPNWCFQRDPQVVLGEALLFASMAAPARHREALLARAAFHFHPELCGVPVLFDPLGMDRRPTLEGGDVLVLSPEVIAVGQSQRTDRTALFHLSRALCRREGAPRWLVAVELPPRRAYMHLDTVLTPIDRDACLGFPPVLRRPGMDAARVFEMDLHAEDPSFAPCTDLLETLARHGLDLELVPCGGADPVAQQREQWTDGANALAVAPGVILLYDRNVATAEELARQGFRIVPADDLLLGRAEVDPEAGHRVCILLASHEISRARGGPHCLTHPLLRDGC
ncbi:MAG TPA: arginine deiminase family protein [Candidatus Polarisedimenticolaceae bacterium]|nr:arginine deiminase family protein [Candidatus Polarisedimenticolaceae bacterium]